jgi:hypothetical protein
MKIDLPDDILAMTEDETACEYCGISYLLFSKYEKLETLVKSLQLQLTQVEVRFSKHPQIGVNDIISEILLGEGRCDERDWIVEDA